MATKKLSVLGSTGSIGRQALSLVEDLGIEISLISGYRNIDLLEEQALRFRPATVCVVETKAARTLQIKLAATGIRVLSGIDALCEAVAADDSDTVLTAVVGVAGLKPTVAAIESGKNIALANKETLVAAGSLITALVQKYQVQLLPVDSEHSAIFQCLQDKTSAAALRRIFLTASGGPFFGKTSAELKNITVEDALRHPNWVMGNKITIDSATMMNKGLELIEAMWLFSLPPQSIEIAVHRQSIVHSMVEFTDGSVLAQLGQHDMRVPIQYALTYPERKPNPVPPLDLADFATMTFDRADEETFSCLAAARKAAEIGKTAPAVANAANEEAVALFLDRQIGFLDIGDAVSHAVNSTRFEEQYTVEQLLETDGEVRAKTREYLSANRDRRKT